MRGEKRGTQTETNEGGKKGLSSSMKYGRKEERDDQRRDAGREGRGTQMSRLLR